MSLKTFVKVGSITNLSDARYCAGMGVHQLGFCYDSSKKEYVSPEDFKDITQWVSGVEFVGEGTGLNELSAYQFNHIEVNNELIDPLEVKVSLKLGIESLYGEVKLEGRYEYVLLTSASEDITDDDLKTISKVAKKFKVLLGFGINTKSLNSILNNKDIYGIVLYGSQEIRPGYKDYDELADILELLDED